MSDTQERYALFGFNSYYPCGGVDDLMTVGTYGQCCEYMTRNVLEHEGYGFARDYYQIAKLSDLTVVDNYTRETLPDGSVVVQKDDDLPIRTD